MISEIFPSRLKGRAGAIASAVNWTSSLILASTFLDMMSKSTFTINPYVTRAFFTIRD